MPQKRQSMKYLFISGIVVFGFGCRSEVTTPTGQHSPATSELPNKLWVAKDFSGSWHGTARVVNKAGSFKVSQHLVLEVDDGGAVKGTIGWVLMPQSSEVGNEKKFGHNADGEKVDEHTEDIVGLANFQRGTLALVECEELGTLSGTIRQDGTIELSRSQPGEFYVVTHAILARDSK